MTVTIRPFRADEWMTYRALRLRSLADAPDAFGSTLAEEALRPLELWQARIVAAAVSDRDAPLLALIGDTAVGLAYAKLDAGDARVVNLYQVWVAPEGRGRGAAAALLDAAIGWARERKAHEMRLTVTCGDTPATRLYRRLGFEPVAAPQERGFGAPLLEQAMRLPLAAD